MGLWTKKSIAVLQAEAAGESTEHTLRRALGALNLTTLGIGRPRRMRGRQSSSPSLYPDSDAFSRACATPNSRA